MKRINKFQLLLLPLLFLMLNGLIAQTPAPQTASNSNSFNTITIVLIIIAIIFIFVIWGMSQVLLALAKLVRDKQKSALVAKTLLIIGFLLMGNYLFAQTNDPSQIATSTSISQDLGLNSDAFYAFSAIIIIQLFVIGFLTFAIRRMYQELMPEKIAEVAEKNKLVKWWSNLDQKVFTKAIPVEKEADALLDHNYDGIRELDNALPPWWKYGFYVTIFVGFIYLFNFHVFGYGKNPTEEYQAEMEVARIAKENYEAQNKDKIDEEHVPMADATGISKGNEIFHTPAMCASCHGQAGEGGAGPNLTDDYWIHKGSLNDVFQSIKHGYPDKGMQAWGSTFTPKEISYLASYIKSLRGTNPPGAQPPRGDLYVEEVKDTTKAVAHPSAAK